MNLTPSPLHCQFAALSRGDLSSSMAPYITWLRRWRVSVTRRIDSREEYEVILCAYLDGDITRLRASVILGSLIPLGALLVWNSIALSLSAQTDQSVEKMPKRRKFINSFKGLSGGLSSTHVIGSSSALNIGEACVLHTDHRHHY
ncbi:hypothetical protein ACFE04_030801 [Oxalis oulophora]